MFNEWCQSKVLTVDWFCVELSGDEFKRRSQDDTDRTIKH